MPPRRSQNVAALVVAAAALLVTFVFGFLSFTPGVEGDVAGFLELGFFAGGIVTIGAFVMYFVMSRRTRSGQTPSKFDRHLEQRAAALGAMPVGLVAVLIGVLWYMSRSLGEGGAWSGPAGAAGETFATIDTAGIAAFLGFGSLYVIMATYFAIRAERAAIGVAREDLEGAE